MSAPASTAKPNSISDIVDLRKLAAANEEDERFEAKCGQVDACADPLATPTPSLQRSPNRDGPGVHHHHHNDLQRCHTRSSQVGVLLPQRVFSSSSSRYVPSSIHGLSNANANASKNVARGRTLSIAGLPVPSLPSSSSTSTSIADWAAAFNLTHRRPSSTAFPHSAAESSRHSQPPPGAQGAGGKDAAGESLKFKLRRAKIEEMERQQAVEDLASVGMSQVGSFLNLILSMVSLSSVRGRLEWEFLTQSLLCVYALERGRTYALPHTSLTTLHRRSFDRHERPADGELRDRFWWAYTRVISRLLVSLSLARHSPFFLFYFPSFGPPFPGPVLSISQHKDFGATCGGA